MKTRKPIFWIGYGIIVASIISVIYMLIWNDTTYCYMPSRIYQLQYYMDYFGTNSTLFNPPPDHNASYYWYLSIFAKSLKITDAQYIYFIIQVIANGMVLMLYPLMFSKLFQGSDIVSFFSPFLYCINFAISMFYFKNDSYWSMGFSVSVGVPIVLIIWKYLNQKKNIYIWGVVLGILIGIGNVPRNHSTLVLLFLIIIMTFKVIFLFSKGICSRKQLFQIFVVCVICISGYSLFTRIIPNLYESVTGEKNFIFNIPAWHTVYISYGFEDNPFGIVYNDSCAAEYVASVDKSIVYLSKEYFDVLYSRLIDMWKTYPLYFIGSYLRKIFLCIQYTIKWSIYSWIIVIAGVVYLKRKGKIDQYLGIGLGMGLFVWLINMIFPLIAIPNKYAYSMGMFSGIHFGALWVMAFVIDHISQKEKLKRNGFINEEDV